MKQYPVIGLGAFGRQVAEELSQLGVELLVLDRDRELVEQSSQRSTVAYCLDALKQDTIQKLIPPAIDAVIVDLGNHLDTSGGSCESCEVSPAGMTDSCANHPPTAAFPPRAGCNHQKHRPAGERRSVSGVPQSVAREGGSKGESSFSDCW